MRGLVASASTLAAFLLCAPASVVAQENCGFRERAEWFADHMISNVCGENLQSCSIDDFSALGYASGRMLEAAVEHGNADVAECIGLVGVLIESRMEDYLGKDSTYETEVRANFNTGLSVGLERLPASAAFIADETYDRYDYHLDVQGFAQNEMGVYGDDYWYRCQHPEWPEGFGVTDMLVPGSVIAARGQGPGVTCEELYDNEASSRVKACEISAADSSVVWAILIDGGTALAPIECDS